MDFQIYIFELKNERNRDGYTCDDFSKNSWHRKKFFFEPMKMMFQQELKPTRYIT